MDLHEHVTAVYKAELMPLYAKHIPPERAEDAACDLSRTVFQPRIKESEDRHSFETAVVVDRTFKRDWCVSRLTCPLVRFRSRIAYIPSRVCARARAV